VDIALADTGSLLAETIAVTNKEIHIFAGWKKIFYFT
jgi:hypothetical protein